MLVRKRLSSFRRSPVSAEPERFLDRGSKIVVAACCVVFLLCGLAIVPYLGIEQDEALFAAALYAPKSYLAGITVLHATLPTMQMSYLGCLKAWVYKAIFVLWPPSVYSLRVPVLLLGALTIFLFWLLLRRTVGDRAAIIGAALLATDTSFLMTTCFDWGPVALQHLLTVAGVLALVYFHQLGGETLLGLAFLLFGLAFWDKALFSWIFTGLTVGSLLVFPAEVCQKMNARRLLIAAFCLCLGALPLICANLRQHVSTFGKEDVTFSTSQIDHKFAVLRATADGSLLFGLVGSEGAPKPRAAHSPLQSLSTSLARVTAGYRKNLANPAFAAALILLPLLWRTPARKPLLFALAVCWLAWALMAITGRAGTSAHHAILLWPFPTLAVAVAFATASKRSCFGRRVLPVAITLLITANLLLTNQYLAGFIRNGGSRVWDDAIFALADYLQSSGASHIYTIDWGSANGLRLLARGALHLTEECYVLAQPQLSMVARKSVLAMISDPDHILVGYTGSPAFPGVNKKLEDLAETAGYEKVVIKTVYDREERPVFEVFRFHRR